MALAKNSVLFYADYTHGVAPIVGGDPGFNRDGGASFVDRQGAMRGLAARIPRQEWMTLDGVVRPALLLEPASTNLIPNPTIEGTVGQTPNGFGVAAGNAVVVAQDVPDVDASAGNGKVARHIRNGATTIDSHVGHQAVNEGANVRFAVSLWVWIPGGSSVDSVRLVVEGAVGSAAVRAADLALRDRWQLVTVTGVSNGTGGTLYLILRVDAARDGQVIYTDGWQYERRAFATRTIFGTNTSRASEQLSYSRPPPPQPLAIYGRMVKGMANDGGYATILSMIVRSDDTGPRSGSHFIGDKVRHFLVNGSSETVADVLFPTAPGDVLEWVQTIHADGTGRLSLGRNGGGFVGGDRSAPLGGLPGAWADGARLFLNSVGTNAIGRNHYAELKIVKLADVVATTDQGRIEELRNFILGPSGDVL
jgi:hypothetical protein